MRTVLGFVVMAVLALFGLWVVAGLIYYWIQQRAWGVFVVAAVLGVPYLFALALERHDARIRQEARDWAWMEFKHRYGIGDDT